MAWLTGVIVGIVGVLLSCLMSLWAATTWPSFNNKLLIIGGLLPLFGFIAGFALVGKREGLWPLPNIGLRCLLGVITAVLSGVGTYLSFLMVAFTWYKDTLPLEKQSIDYMIFHPADVPAVKVQSTRTGQAPTERDETWHVLTIICFAVGGFAGFAWSGRGSSG